jgi:hypothetical protein
MPVLEDLADGHEEADGDGPGGEPLTTEDVPLAAGEVRSGGRHASNLLHRPLPHIGESP